MSILLRSGRFKKLGFVCLVLLAGLLVQPVGMPRVYAGQPGTVSFQWVSHGFSAGTIQPTFLVYGTNTGSEMASYYVKFILTSPGGTQYTDMHYFMMVSPGQTQWGCMQMDSYSIASFESGTWTVTIELRNFSLEQTPLYDTASDTFSWSSAGAPPAVTEEPAPEIHWTTSTPFPEYKVGEYVQIFFDYSDPEGDTLKMGSNTWVPTWLTVDFAGKRLHGTPSESDIGSFSPAQVGVNDNHCLESWTTQQTITVIPNNTPPVLSGTPDTSVDEDAFYDWTPTLTDPDEGDSHTFSCQNQPSWASFSTTTGRLYGTPTNAHVGTTSNIVISVEDAAEASDSLNAFSITVNNTNDAPTISGSPSSAVDEDNVYSFTPSITDDDSIHSDTYSCSSTNVPTWLTFSTANGSLSGTPRNSDVGVHSGIMITVTDVAGASDTLGPFSITVSNTNDAPTISGTPETSVDEDALYEFTPTLHDDDTIHGDTYTCTVTSKPSWATLVPSSGRLYGTPDNDDLGTYDNIVITVTDADGAHNALSPFSITVNNTNDAPVITGTATTSVNEDAYYAWTPTLSDVDPGDELYCTIENKPGWASLNTATGELYGTPCNGDVQTWEDITISVHDKAGATDTLTYAITVHNTEDEPVAVDDEGTTGAEQPVILDVLANDTDDDLLVDSPRPADTLTIVQVDDPAHGVAEIVRPLSIGPGVPDRDGSTIRYTPEEGFRGVETFAYTVSDGQGGTDSGTISVTVEAGDINGLIFADWNGDGIRQIEEQTGLAGIVVTARHGSGLVKYTKACDSGWFAFYALTPGVWNLSHDPIPGYADTSIHPTEAGVLAGEETVIIFGVSDDVEPTPTPPSLIRISIPLLIKG